MALGRLLEFLSPAPLPWNRSLWSIGLVLGLHELHEACHVLRSGTLSDASVKRICSGLQRKAGRDPALSNEEKAHLRLQISSVPKADGPAHHAVAQVAELLEADYLRRWARVVAGPGFTVEHFARSVASHVLDVGFSAHHLHALIKNHVVSGNPVTLSDICEDLHVELARSPRRPFEVLLAFRKPPRLAQGIPARWLKGAAVTEWLTARGFDTADVRAPVALVLTVEARDYGGAAQSAREMSDRFAARARIALGAPLERLPWLWVAGDAARVRHASASRGVRVKELDREGRIFSSSPAGDGVDAAIELLAHLDESSPPAAIAGGWGAIEGLLADPGDRATAADNLAALVACSFPRAELTPLSYVAAKQDAGIAAQMAGQTSNRDRARSMATLILNGQAPALTSPADQAAVARVSKLLNDPSRELATVKETIAEAFHRLYRQRNLILHGGRLDSVTLKASLRTVAGLAGAGIDRITHGHYVQSFRPLELVARADLSIALINQSTALSCVDLLERV